MDKEPTSQTSKPSKAGIKDTDKTASKTIGASKAPVKKTTSSTQSKTKTAKRETLVSLRAHVDRVEARLKRADALTRKSIKAIETSFDRLAEQSKNQSQSNQTLDISTEQAKDDIRQHVQMLTGQLTRMVETTRASVTSELSGALSAPNLDHLKSALNIVDEQITETDMKLSRAISSINRNIADIAMAVDEQIKTHAATQIKAVDSLRSETEKARYALIQKLDRIEQDSAHAIRTIGDKVTSATNKIKEASDIKADVLRDDVTKLVETTQLEVKSEIQANLDALKREIKSRIDTLESDHVQATKQRERGYKSLETRIESLEFGLNTVTEAVAKVESGREDIPIAAAFDTPPKPIPGKSALTMNGSVFGMDLSSDNPNIGEVDYLNPEAAAPLASISETVALNLAHSDSAGAVSAAQIASKPQQEQAGYASSENTGFSESFGLSNDTQIQTGGNAQQDGQDPSIISNPYSEDFLEIQAIAKGETQSQSGFIAQISNSSRTAEYQPQDFSTHAQSETLSGQPVEYTPPYGQGATISNIQPYLNGSNPQSSAPLSDMNAYSHDALSSEAMTQGYSKASLDELNNLPYENPAYADPSYNSSDDSMATARPGAYSKAKKAKASVLKRPTFSKQNKRTLALALGVTAVSLVGIRLLTDNTATPNADKTITTANVGTNQIVPATQNPAVSMVETIGDYADNKGIAPDTNSAGFNDLESAAKGGDPIAQFQLGLSYLQNGRTNEAVKLIRLSADSGLAAAQYRLAKLYEVGEGVTEDAVMARTLTERAARTGNRIAMHDLALYYAEGRGGVDLDMVTAAKWFEKAAERGVVDSQFNLGVLFESGQGLPQNLTDAYIWYSIAAKQGDQLAAQQLAVLSTQLDSKLIKSADARVKNFKPTRIDKKANGIFENVPWSVNVDKTAQINRVKLAQDLLSELGYDAGAADGAMGPRTRTAIMSFEKTNNLPETGRVSAELIDRLTLAAGA